MVGTVAAHIGLAPVVSWLARPLLLAPDIAPRPAIVVLCGGCRFSGHLNEARDALSWAFLLADINPSDPLPFLNTPLAFGARAQDVVAGAKAATGKASLDVTFMNPAPGAPLPDLVQLLNTDQPAQLPWRFKFQSKACGSMPDGTSAQLEVQQTCSNDGSGPVCRKEIVDIRPGKCGGGDD